MSPEDRLQVVFLRVPRSMKQRLEELAISKHTSLNKLANDIFVEWEKRQQPKAKEMLDGIRN